MLLEVIALFTLSMGFLEGTFEKGITSFDRVGMRKSVFPPKLDGVKFTV